ncbi:MAG: alpha/beta hydrolase family protein [Acidobacteriota bacterium]
MRRTALRAVPATLALVAALAGAAAAEAVPVAPAVVNDPAPRDPRAPATLAGVRIPSHGDTMNGLLMVAAGAEPHPIVLLLHGFPGYEGLLDVGEAIRRAGFDVLAFHYRGSWGSGGSFSFSHCIEDAHAAVEFVRSPRFAAQYPVDPNRIYAVGHSMGGFVAVMLAAADPNVKGIAYISGWDIGSDARRWRDPRTQAAVQDSFDLALPALRRTNGATLLQEAIQHSQAWSLASVAARIADRPVLMTVAEFEAGGNPPTISHEPLRNALRAAGARSLETHSFPTDHSYSDQRIALASTIVTWLQRISGRGP